VNISQLELRSEEFDDDDDDDDDNNNNKLISYLGTVKFQLKIPKIKAA
jgi:hypothetical protein